MIYKYKHTSFACYLGYITQALVITLPTLLFTVFYNKFGITLSEIGILITANFFVQLLMDLTSTLYINKTGYRIPAVFAHFSAFLGLILLSVLPELMKDHRYFAICIPVFISSIGGGLIEVLISPVMEAIPNKKKSASMSLLHSFFCWGQVGTILLTTLYFIIFDIKYWYFLPAIWSVVPFFNMIYFLKVPLPKPLKEKSNTRFIKLLKNKYFLLYLIIMLCSGASEQSMSQWASLFAETGLGISKTAGDLIGPALFGVLMGISRVYYGLKSEKINLSKLVLSSGVLCVISYIVTIFSPYSIISLISCAICGLSVGILWPGTFSLTSERFKGGASMFALLAFAGDLGCSTGPGLVGVMSDLFKNFSFSIPFLTGNPVQQSLKFGLLIAVIFPLLLIVSVKKTGDA